METMTHEATELKIYIENDGELYRQQTQAIHKNLSKKHKGGRYDHKLAPKMWRYLADNGAKKYTKEFDSRSGFGCFTPAMRQEVAQALADEYLVELEAKNYTV